MCTLCLLVLLLIPMSSPAISQPQLEVLYGHVIATIVEGHIYLSGGDAAIDKELMLNVIKITHVINASNGAIVNKFDNHIAYLNVNIEDKDDQNIIEYFDKVYAFLPESNCRVLFNLKFVEALLQYEKETLCCNENSINYFRLTGVRNRPSSLAVKPDSRASDMTYETNNPVSSPPTEAPLKEFIANNPGSVDPPDPERSNNCCCNWLMCK